MVVCLHCVASACAILVADVDKVALLIIFRYENNQMGIAQSFILLYGFLHFVDVVEQRVV